MVVGDTNAYIMDVGAGGLIAYGGDYLSLVKEKYESRDGTMDIEHVFDDT